MVGIPLERSNYALSNDVLKQILVFSVFYSHSVVGASIVTNQCVYEGFYGYFECLNIVFVVLFLTLWSLFVLLHFSHFGIVCDFWLGLVTLLADR